MDEEITSIEKNDTLKLVPKPSEKKPIPVKWIIKKKECQKKRWRGGSQLIFFFTPCESNHTYTH
jgi:hypothetical protein